MKTIPMQQSGFMGTCGNLKKEIQRKILAQQNIKNITCTSKNYTKMPTPSMLLDKLILCSNFQDMEIYSFRLLNRLFFLEMSKICLNIKIKNQQWLCKRYKKQNEILHKEYKEQ